MVLVDLSADDLPAPRPQRWLNEPRRPVGVAQHPRAYWLAVAAVCIGAFMGQLDASIVTVALPTLQRTFHASLGAVTWVGLSYLIVLVATVTAVGRFADMVGRKLLYLYGFGVFIVGSTLCGLAPTLGALVGFRAIQAVGAAMLQANSLAIIMIAVPAERLGRALGIQGAAQAVGLALGPSVGGFLLIAGGWRLIFFVTIPFGIVGAAVGWLCIPRSRQLQERTPFDWRGLGLFFPAVVALLCAVSFGNSLGWGSPQIAGLGVVTVLLGFGFVRRERRAVSPMLDLSLFKRARFSMGIASGLLSYLVLFGVLFAVPFFFERGLGLASSWSGVELMVMPVALGLVAPFSGKLADRVGPRPLTVLGMALVAGALCVLAVPELPRPLFLFALAVVGAGLGLFTAPNNASVMGSVPRQQAGVASGVLNMTRGMGTALGLACTGLVFGLAGGDAVVASAARHAFSITALFLALVALVALTLAALTRNVGATARGAHNNAGE
jgi:EmrB/QacA subfamily drug resistance transporter